MSLAAQGKLLKLSGSFLSASFRTATLVLKSPCAVWSGIAPPHAEAHHDAREAEAQGFAGLIEPVPALVEGQISFPIAARELSQTKNGFLANRHQKGLLTEKGGACFSKLEPVSVPPLCLVYEPSKSSGVGKKEEGKNNGKNKKRSPPPKKKKTNVGHQPPIAWSSMVPNPLVIASGPAVRRQVPSRLAFRA